MWRRGACVSNTLKKRVCQIFQHIVGLSWEIMHSHGICDMSLRKSFALKFLKLRAIFTLSRDFGRVNFLKA